jgi:para-aminobenzoate synthetase/4-amino-4-deoxychorismate lyase
MKTPYVYFEDQLARGGRWKRRLYKNPVDLITAYAPDEINNALEKLQQAHEDGYYLTGFFAYELGYLLEPKLAPLLPKTRTGPLLQFGVFECFEKTGLKPHGKARIGWMTPHWMKTAYLKRFARIRDYIRAGDVYQINLTFPLTGRYQGSAAAIYEFLKKRQPVHYGGVVDLNPDGEGDAIVTLSPELFYETNKQTINMRPMKGTIKRGASEVDDLALATHLQNDPKNRAENLMIVDLLRNDLSRLSKPGSVKVADLFKIETYPSLHTMTSGISAQMNAGTTLSDLLKSLFPCGSVTGAPKIRAMEIINELEDTPRGAYCGAIGMIDPDGSSRFNVAIRTLRLSADGTLTYNVGSGVVADSDGAAEYAECLLKAAFLTDGNFDLIETLGWHEQTGFMHLDLHLERLAGSAFTFGFAFPKIEIKQALDEAVTDLSGPRKVRLTLAHDGGLTTRADQLTPGPADTAWRVAISKNRLKSRDRLLRHKTTSRHLYDNELARIRDLTDCHEAIFFNEKDQLCEGSFTNVFVRQGGRLYTPRLSCGLLPGILRRVLIENGDAREKILTRDDLLTADAVYVGNAARGLIKAELLENEH